jgi:hypothetical protein
MTSFASAFGSSDQGQIYSNNNGMYPTNNLQELNQFSNIDLDQQPPSSKEQYPSYTSLDDAATFQSDSLSAADAILSNNPSHNRPFSSQEISSSQTPNIFELHKHIVNFILR